MLGSPLRWTARGAIQGPAAEEGIPPARHHYRSEIPSVAGAAEYTAPMVSA